MPTCLHGRTALVTARPGQGRKGHRRQQRRPGPTADLSEDHIDTALAVNIKAVIHGATLSAGGGLAAV